MDTPHMMRPWILGLGLWVGLTISHVDSGIAYGAIPLPLQPSLLQDTQRQGEAALEVVPKHDVDAGRVRSGSPAWSQGVLLAQSRTRDTLRGAGRGAALGAIGGAIAGDAGKGAAIGAAVGGISGNARGTGAGEGAARGAALGAVTGAIAGKNVGKSAAIGAGIGAISGSMGRR